MKYITRIALFVLISTTSISAQNGISLEYDCSTDCIDLSINGGEGPYDVLWTCEFGIFSNTPFIPSPKFGMGASRGEATLRFS